MAFALIWTLLCQAPETSAASDALERGLRALKANDVAAARALLEQAVKQSPNDPIAWLAAADARLRSGELAGAEVAVNRAGQLAPADGVVARGRMMFARRLGNAWLEARQEKRAEATLRAAAQAFPRDAELRRLLGLAFYAQGRPEQAMDAFLAAIDLAPAEESHYASLETLLPMASRSAAVETRLRAYAAKHAESPVAWYLLGLAQSDPAHFERALAARPDFWPAAFALHRYVDQQRAGELLEQVVKLNPEYAPAYYALAQSYAQRGEREKALAARQRHHELGLR
jgi:Tfp pilus assembly protein PilF